jgi:hypothetical protein
LEIERTVTETRAAGIDKRGCVHIHCEGVEGRGAMTGRFWGLAGMRWWVGIEQVVYRNSTL